jgi:hypothetical protein
MPDHFPTPQHASLDILAGRWTTTITMLDRDGCDGETSSATDTYAWSASRHFLVHDVDAMMDGAKIQSFEIIAVDQGTGQYQTRSYDADGSINDFTAMLDGDVWRINGREQRFEGRFSTDRTELAGLWRQRDGERWEPSMRVLLRRQG